MNNNFRPVYSSDQGRLCPACGQPAAACTCRKYTGGTESGDGIVRIGRESKGRGGKTVTVITGLPQQGEALKHLVKQLKQRCGTGGTIKDRQVEIQGDHRETLAAELTRLGYVVKWAGG